MSLLVVMNRRLKCKSLFRFESANLNGRENVLVSAGIGTISLGTIWYVRSRGTQR